MDNNTNSLLIILLDEIDFENSKGVDEPKVSHLYDYEYLFLTTIIYRYVVFEAER